MRPRRHPRPASGRGPLLGWLPIEQRVAAVQQEAEIGSSHARRASRRERLSEAMDATRRTIRHRRWLSEASALLPDIARVAGLGAITAAPSGRAVGRAGTVTFVVRDGTAGEVVAKLARTEAGIDSLRRAADAQRGLLADEALGDWRRLIPAVVGEGSHEPWYLVVERRLPGEPISESAPGDGRTPARLAAALRAIGRLHLATAAPIDPATAVTTWVDRRISGLGPLIAAGFGPVAAPDADPPLERIAGELRGAIAAIGAAGWIHGDLWSANVLVDPAGHVTGIVDWDSAAPGELPDHDVLHLVLYARKLREHRPLGRVLASVLVDGWAAADRELLAAAPPSALATRDALLLYWLRFVEVNVRRQPDLARSSGWLDHNVRAVAACL